MFSVKKYIQNEINYINRYGLECDKQDIAFLKHFSNKDLEDIQKLVNKDIEAIVLIDGDDLEQKANEIIHYYLYKD